jgi:hypothetical protein
MYSETHIKFELHWSRQDKVLYKLLQEELGDTDHMEPLQNRIWFTLPGGVCIRKDINIPHCITYALLSN